MLYFVLKGFDSVCTILKLLADFVSSGVGDWDLGKMRTKHE